jgi:hypothetical protein
MRIRMLFSGLAASAVLLAAGTAFSGGNAATTDNTLVDFNQKTGELWGFPPGQITQVYLHDHHSRHELADLTRFLPPDPCLPIAEVWNELVATERNNGIRNVIVFGALLDLMARFQCRATVTSVTDGSSPQPIVVIAPAAR